MLNLQPLNDAQATNFTSDGTFTRRPLLAEDYPIQKDHHHYKNSRESMKNGEEDILLRYYNGGIINGNM